MRSICSIFGNFFSFEFKKLSGKRKILIFLLITASFLYLVQDGINVYEGIIQNVKTFQEVEKLKIQVFTSMKQYALYGFRISFIPVPLSVLFYNSTIFSDITAIINNSERLELYSPMKGKALFSEKPGRYTDFSGVVFLIGCFLSCLYGLQTFKNKEYLKFRSTLADYKKVFLFETFSRMILLNLVFLFCVGLSFIWVFIKGINIFNSFLLWYIILSIVLLNFFFSLGLALSTIKNKINQYIIFALVYIALVFFVPWSIDKIISKRAEMITPSYQLEMEKLDIYSKFEKRALENQGKYTKEKGKTSAGRNLIESFWNGEFIKMQAIEERMIKEIEENANAYQLYSMFCPTSFYRSVIYEIGSRGYSSFLEYYRDIKEKDKRFMRLFLDKKYYSENDEVESFIKNGDENTFYVKSGLPSTFLPGLLLTIFYSFLALLFAFILNRKLFKINKSKLYGFKFPDVKNAAFILCQNDRIKNEIFSYYQQQDNISYLEKLDTRDFQFDLNPYKVFKHMCKISRVDENTAIEKLELLGIKGIENLKALKTLSHEDILKIYAAVRTSLKCDYIIINDFVKGETRRFERSFFDLLSFYESSGKKIIYLSCEIYNQSASLNDYLHIDKFKIFDLPLCAVSLR